MLANYIIYSIMPVIKSAKKQMRKALKRTERNKGTKTQVKTFMKKVMDLSKTNKEEAKKLLPKAFKVIDTAAKKKVLHKNNAARKKSLLYRSIEKVAVEKTVAPKKAAATSKAKTKKTATKKKK